MTITLTPQPDPPAAEQLREALPELRRLNGIAEIKADGTIGGEQLAWDFTAGSLGQAIRDVERLLQFVDAQAALAAP